MSQETSGANVVRRALTIAGSDSGGGAGIQADLKTFFAYGVYGTSAITAVTAQNTLEVTRIDFIPADGIAAQIDAVLSDIGADAIKIGMLGKESAVRAVAKTLRRFPGIPIVLDPVMIAKSGAHLLAGEAVRALVDELLPLATVLTPNLPEAAALLGRAVGESGDERLAAARALRVKGAAAVLLKDGHGTGELVRDLLVADGAPVSFEHSRRTSRSTHGTGCTLAAAIAAGLALGHPLEQAVAEAVHFVDRAMAAATPLGAGHGPLQHGWDLHPRQQP